MPWGNDRGLDDMAWAFSVATQTDPRAIRVVRRMIRDIVEREGGSEEDAWGLELALGEALFNAHTHAYSGGVGPVEVAVGLDDETLTVTVRDRGEPVSTPSVPHALPSDNKCLGLFLISSVVDFVDIRQNEDAVGLGVSITMIKRLQSGNGNGLTQEAAN